MADQVRPGGTLIEKVPVMVGIGLGCAAVWLLVAHTCAWTAGNGFDLLDLAGAAAETTRRPWLVGSLVAVVTAVAAWVAWVMWQRGADGRMRTSYRNLDGLGSVARVRAVGGRRAVLGAAKTLRESIEKPQITDVAYFEGSYRGCDLYSSVRETKLVIGPPGAGKGYFVVVNRILDSVGACVTTSTRPDNLAITMRARGSENRPVHVFDPEGLAAGVATGKKWSPIRGCEDTMVASARAAAIVEAGYPATGENAIWANWSRQVLGTLLHAAALGGYTARDLYRWTLAASECDDALRALESPRAGAGWAKMLRAQVESDPRQRDNVWSGMNQALGCLSHAAILEAVSPKPGEELDVVELLRGRGTLYLLGTAQGAVASAALVAALVEDVVMTAKKMAAASPRARLDPPLSLVLDEAANYPLPSIDALMSEGGGSGINTTLVFQSVAQMRKLWGPDRARGVWDSATVKTVLGGSADPETLRDISNLIGERDEITHSINRDTRSLIGARSFGESVRKSSVMTAAQLRELPFGMSLLMLKSAPPAVVDLRAWTSRTEASDLDASRREVEETVRTGHERRSAHLGG